MATFNLSSTAIVITSDTAAIVDIYQGKKVLTSRGFFFITLKPAGLTITKAATLNGAQGALAFPISRDAALDLFVEGLKIVT